MNNTSQLKIALLGLTVTSSWPDSYFSVYRSLMRGLAARGHDVLFLERDIPWYAIYRDRLGAEYGRIAYYSNIENLKDCFVREISDADMVLIGSDLPQITDIASWVKDTARGVTAFYDIDTMATLSYLGNARGGYAGPGLIPFFDLHLSSTGGRLLTVIKNHYGASDVRPFYYSVEPERFCPGRAVASPAAEKEWDLGCIGMGKSDQSPSFASFLVAPANQWKEGRFAMAGIHCTPSVELPPNIERIKHLSPVEHERFYHSSRFALAVSNAETLNLGYCPRPSLFEAACSGIPVISYYWEGLESFFELGKEVLVACSTEHILHYLKKMPEEERHALGARARARVLSRHTSLHRALQLEEYVRELLSKKSRLCAVV